MARNSLKTRAMSTRIHAFLISLSLATAGCEAADPSITDEVTLDGDDAKFDVAADIYVRTGDTSLWVDSYLGRRGSTFVLHGRTSRDITSGTSFDQAAPSGAFTNATARTLDVAWTLPDTESLADGADHF